VPLEGAEAGAEAGGAGEEGRLGKGEGVPGGEVGGVVVGVGVGGE